MEKRMAEDAIVCPHCDFADGLWHEYVDPTEMFAEFEQECPKCKKPFNVVMETTVTFKTEQLEGEPFDEEDY
jgi:hypothetical protein